MREIVVGRETRLFYFLLPACLTSCLLHIPSCLVSYYLSAGLFLYRVILFYIPSLEVSNPIYLFSSLFLPARSVGRSGTLLIRYFHSNDFHMFLFANLRERELFLLFLLYILSRFSSHIIRVF